MKDGVPTGEYEDFVTGFVIDDSSVWGRPVGVAQAQGWLVADFGGRQRHDLARHQDCASLAALAPHDVRLRNVQELWPAGEPDMPKLVRYDLSGRKAIVTGAASGIGLGTAAALAQAGAKVALNHLPDDPRGAQAVQELRAQGLDVIGAPGRVGVPKETETMIETAIAALGGLDLLVNNAGTPGVKETVPVDRLDLVTDEMWDTILATNLVGIFRCTKTAAPALKAARGAVVNTASIAALGLAGSSMAYAASKAGVVNLTRNLARGLAPDVRVNAIAPGAVDSPWIEWTDQQRKGQVEKALLKRIGKPSDYADVILFLAFGSEFVTGETVVVDGGLTL